MAANTGTQAAGSRQRGRSRLEPDQAHRDRRDQEQLLMTRGALTTFSIANGAPSHFTTIIQRHSSAPIPCWAA